MPPAPTPPERAVVIGAGFGGLAAAIRLAALGAQVTVLDMAEGPGGKARGLPSPAGPVDTGPTVMTLPQVAADLFALCGTRIADEVDLIPLPRLARHFWPGSAALDLFTDREANVESIRALCGDREAAAFARFDAGRRPLRRLRRADDAVGPSPPCRRRRRRPARARRLARASARHDADPPSPPPLPRPAPRAALRALRDVCRRPPRPLSRRPLPHLAGRGRGRLRRPAGDARPRRSPGPRGPGARRHLPLRHQGAAHRPPAGPRQRGGNRRRRDAALHHLRLQRRSRGACRGPSRRCRPGRPAPPRPRPAQPFGLGLGLRRHAAGARPCPSQRLLHRRPGRRIRPHRPGADAASPTVYVCAQDRELGTPVPALERFELILNGPAGHPSLPDEVSTCRTRTSPSSRRRA